ncbi:unnamed protein product [Adineta ricciae]|uniref:Uncharacterized protein n=1 Tax=Adineta ricciae TaxID=249248 RepID=A0A815Q413_ADIRI|nr:unnamed protein product [Adineta ricciae]
MYPICSSYFIEQEWIKSLYFENASQYGVWDFRTTAYSQFEILSKFCLLSKEILNEIRLDINKTKLVTFSVHSEKEIEIEINRKIDFLNKSMSYRIISFLHYLKNTIQTHRFTSSLNTNSMILTRESEDDDDDQFLKLESHDVSYDSNKGHKICSKYNSLINATVSSVNYETILPLVRTRMKPMVNSTIINGFYTGCTPLDAILHSTLDCLYDITCLQLLLKYFPNLKKINFNPNSSILTSEYEYISINESLNNLFIKNWSKNINYFKYFNECSPLSCSYSMKERTELSYSITLFISLYSGLIIILRLVSSFTIDFITKLRFFFQKTKSKFKQLFLVYDHIVFFLLSGSICVLCLFTSLNDEILTITVRNISIIEYKSLEIRYSNTLRCPCLNKGIMYKNFLSISPRFHQICSSGFVNDYWIYLLKEGVNSVVYNDWRNGAYAQFQLLRDFCKLADETIDDSIKRYLSQLFISSSIINQNDFNKQINSSLNQFYKSISFHFQLMINISQLLMQIDQFYTSAYGAAGYESGINLIQIDKFDATIKNKTINFQFLLNGIQEIDSNKLSCICATNPNCEMSSVIYSFGLATNPNNGKIPAHNISGWIHRCTHMNSLLYSTLECFYEDSECFPFVLRHLDKQLENVHFSLSNSIEPLISNQNLSQFSPNTTISNIFKEIMIEEWNISLFYDLFYKECSPIHCTYSKKVRKENFLGVIIILISMINGIMVSLRILTPRLILFSFKLLEILSKKKRKRRIQQNRSNRIKRFLENLLKLFVKTLFELNIFSSRDFGYDTDRLISIKYGQWATRLYMFSFIFTITILFFYTNIQSRIVTKNFDKPDLNSYEKLRESYGNKLQCLCSKIASTYNDSLKIETRFHPICSSQFIAEEWRISLTNGLISNLSIYHERDYRRFLSAHLQYLQGLCQISQNVVYNSINELLSSLLITIELLPKENFEHRLNILIEQSQSNSPILLSYFLSMTRIINHGNAFLSTYGTNFLYKTRINRNPRSYLYTESITYDNQCSCGMFSNCTSQAYFLEENSSFPIKGMKMGCTPSESFLESTLECFYDQSCLNLIYQYTNLSNSSIALNTSIDFLPNLTINELIHHSFIKQWLNITNYSSYYNICSPSICSYTSLERFNFLYIITLFLSLQGGLTLVFKWISPKIIQIIFTIYNYYKTKRNSIYPIVILSNNINIQTRERRISENTRIILSIQHYLKITLLFIFLIGILIIFSIYYAKTISTKNGIADNTTAIIMSTSSTISDSFCELEFEEISMNISCNETNFRFLISTGHFNKDNSIDIIYLCDNLLNSKIFILFGNNNGTFQKAIINSFENINEINHMNINDFNNDNQSDILLIYNMNMKSYLIVLQGNTNGRFEKSFIPVALKNDPQKISVNHLNNDKILDIIMIMPVEENIYVMFGNSNGSFSLKYVLFTALYCELTDLVVGHVNYDEFVDIIVYDGKSSHIYVFFGTSNGTFLVQKSFFTSIDSGLNYISIDYLNNNNIVFLYQWKDIIYMTYQYNNNRFIRNHKIILESIEKLISVLMIDINHDNHSDIIGLSRSHGIYGLFSYENGQFNSQKIYAKEIESYFVSLLINDINNDNYQDMITVDRQTMSIYILLNKNNCL